MRKLIRIAIIITLLVIACVSCAKQRYYAPFKLYYVGVDALSGKQDVILQPEYDGMNVYNDREPVRVDKHNVITNGPGREFLIVKQLIKIQK